MPKRFSAMLMGALCALLSVVGMAPVAAAGLPATNTAWTWQNPAPSGDQLGAIAYRVGAEAWCVGLGRGLYKTTDEGSSWSVTRTGPTLGFYDIAFGSATHGAAVGESSSAWDFTGHTLMWRTSDGGTTWKPAAVSGTVMPLGALDYGDATHAWAVGRFGTVLASTDAGLTWAAQATPPEVSGVDLTGVSFVDAQNGWAVGCDVSDGESFIIRTTDGGTTWSLIDVIGGSFLFECDFVDSTNGWACGMGGTAWHTSDGGATWSAQALPSTDFYTKAYGLDFASSTQGWLVTNQGKIYATSNAGASWSIQKTVDGAQLMGIAMRDTTHGVATGEDGVVLTTTDGVTWTVTSTGVRTPLVDSVFISATKGWTVGFGGQVLKTTDGGATWTAKKINSRHLVAVDFTNASNGYVCGRHGVVLRTVNGGAAWKVRPTRTTRDLNGVDFVSATRGWVVGTDGLILTTANGGATWKRQKSGTTVDLADVFFLDSKRGWACGLEKGLVLRTTDGGAHWRKATARLMPWPGATLSKITFVTRTKGWVCGISPAGGDTLGAVFATSNGGRTWRAQIPSDHLCLPEQALLGIDFADADHGWAVGQDGLYLYTTDGGATWRLRARVAPDEALLDVKAADTDNVYIVGTGGTILKTTSGGH